MKPWKLNLLPRTGKWFTATKTPHSFHLNKQRFDTARMTMYNNVPRDSWRHFQEGCTQRKAAWKTGSVGRDATRRASRHQSARKFTCLRRTTRHVGVVLSHFQYQYYSQGRLDLASRCPDTETQLDLPLSVSWRITSWHADYVNLN
jgi:hypothetical protein